MVTRLTWYHSHCRRCALIWLLFRCNFLHRSFFYTSKGNKNERLRHCIQLPFELTKYIKIMGVHRGTFLCCYWTTVMIRNSFLYKTNIWRFDKRNIVHTGFLLLLSWFLLPWYVRSLKFGNCVWLSFCILYSLLQQQMTKKEIFPLTMCKTQGYDVLVEIGDVVHMLEIGDVVHMLEIGDVVHMV